jgi:hypothetical protein
MVFYNKQALSNLIPDFEKMWSCKVRLAALLEEMARGACEVLIKCRNEINFLLFEVRHHTHNYYYYTHITYIYIFES